MLKKIDRFGFIEVNGQAYYLHWSLANEWAEVNTRRGVMYAETIVGRFKLSQPHAIYMTTKTRLTLASGGERITGSSQAAV